MANRKVLPKQLNQAFSAQTLISTLQSQLDADGDLRAALTDDLAEINAGSNHHLAQLLSVASSIEGDINELLCDLTLAWRALEVYSIAAGSSNGKVIDLHETTSIFMKILPDCHLWEGRMHEHFKQFWAMKRGIIQH